MRNFWRNQKKMLLDKVNLLQKFALFDEYCSPKIVGELNGQQVKLVKFKGEFVWHHHEDEDEMFYVVKGSFEMHYRQKVDVINEGEFVIVPKNIEHKPVAPDEVWVMLFEPASTVNTGNLLNELTKTRLGEI
jgi:mannose-6-phosphate isomerase-like protein (cupin superfamily)